MSLRRISGVFYFKWKRMWRSRGIIFWGIIWPVLLILLSAYVFISPANGPVTLKVGVLNEDLGKGNFTGSDLVKVMENVTYKGKPLFKVINYSSEGSLRKDLKEGKLDLGILIPRNFSSSLAFGQAYLKVLVGSPSPYSGQINYAIITSFIQKLNENVSNFKIKIFLSYVPKGVKEEKVGNETLGEMMQEYLKGIALPINASYEEVYPKTYSSRPYQIGFCTIGAIGMMMLYMGLGMGAEAIYEEKERKTLRRIASMPISEYEILGGIYLSLIALFLVSSVIGISFGTFACGARISLPRDPIEIAMVPLDLLLLAVMSIGIGSIISILVKKSPQSVGTALGLILSFIAGIWFPSSWMPAPLRILSEIFPPTWGVNLLRYIIVYQRPLPEVFPLFLKVLISSIFLFAFSMAIYRRSLRKYLEA